MDTLMKQISSKNTDVKVILIKETFRDFDGSSADFVIMDDVKGVIKFLSDTIDYQNNIEISTKPEDIIVVETSASIHEKIYRVYGIDADECYKITKKLSLIKSQKIKTTL